MGVVVELPVHCHGRQVGWHSWLFPCYSCIPKYSWWDPNKKKTILPQRQRRIKKKTKKTPLRKAMKVNSFNLSHCRIFVAV